MDALRWVDAWMRTPLPRLAAWMVWAALALLTTRAEADPRSTVAAIVGVKAEVPANARTSDTLGRERSGTGVVIDSGGLVLTIGYLILEATSVDLYPADGKRIPADIVAYDHDTGLGLVRATIPLGVAPIRLGSSKDVAVGEPLLVLSRDGALGGREAKLASRREFAGYWEYLLPDALFTTPPHGEFAGAALIDRSERLVGIGSLLVPDATASEVDSPGNMFVPTDTLPPVLGDLLALGHRDGPGHPWVGVSAQEHGGHLIVRSVADDGPAATAGVRPGDILVAVGGAQVGSLAELYRGMWRLGDPGVTVPLRILRDNRVIELSVPSIDRMHWLRLNQTY
jgi:S1-C subfamily serine protease